MKFGWKPEKNEKLKAERGISFEDIEAALATGGLKGMLKYTGRIKIHMQHVILLVECEGQLWAVPAVVAPMLIFFRTAYQVEEDET